MEFTASFIVKPFLSIINIIEGWIIKARKKEQEKWEGMSKYIQDISNCMISMADTFDSPKNDSVPSTAGHNFISLVQDLERYIGKLKSTEEFKKEINELVIELRSVQDRAKEADIHLGRQFITMHNVTENELKKLIRDLRGHVGDLRALARKLKMEAI